MNQEMKKNLFSTSRILAFFLLAGIAPFGFAQDLKIQNWRSYDQDGLNVFEPAKDLTTPFNGLKVRIGGSFTQQFQGISHSNQADFDTISYRGKVANGNELYALAPGFNLAAANLFVDVQLADGIRIALENYMSSRHHSEFWVKGGYIQMDKLPMFGSPEWFTNNFRVKVGHFQVNYGDQQFRRSDNGNTMYNPFVGNYVMDAFATEIASEVYYFNPTGLMVMGGISTGNINGNITAADNRAPSVFGKVAFDRQLNEDLRIRLSASAYLNNNASRSTLYAGDRAGSRFFLALEPAYFLPRGATAYTTANSTDLATSGRVSPGFSNEVQSISINPFVKFKGLEVFGTFETSSGLAFTDPKADGATEPATRTVSQLGVEGIYRFLKNEQVYIGARYNEVSGQLDARIAANGVASDLSVNRLEVVAGWYPIKNLLVKASYVNQQYEGYPSSNLYYQGEFHGVMVEAAVGF